MLKSGIHLVVPLFFRNFAPRNDNKQLKHIKTMEKFKKVTKPERFDFYCIELDKNGKKQIHILGYIYPNDSNDFWELLEPCWFIIPLEEFIKNLKENEDYVNEQYSEYNQYITDMTEEEMVRTINNFFDGNPPEYYLGFSEITMDTPCGDYVI